LHLQVQEAFILLFRRLGVPRKEEAPFLGTYGVFRDITDRKQAEEALRRSDERLKHLAENAHEMIYRMSLPSGRYEYVSPASSEIFGFTPEDFYNGRGSFKYPALHLANIGYFSFSKGSFSG
jgi:PAS domain-containing protein